LKAKLTAKGFRGSMEDLERTEMILNLSKFKMEETIELKEILVEVRGAIFFKKSLNKICDSLGWKIFFIRGKLILGELPPTVMVSLCERLDPEGLHCG
jgi:hypothetical protein